MADNNIVATAVVEIVPDTSKFKQQLGQQLNQSTATINKNAKISPMVDDIKLRQNAMRIQNQYEKLADGLRNVFAGIGVLGLGAGKSAIGGFLKSDTVEAKVLRSQLGDLSTAWAKVGGKLAQANFGGKTLGQWVEKLAGALDKLSIEKIERFAKIAGGFAIAGGFIQALKVANNIMDTFEKIGILQDKRSLIGGGGGGGGGGNYLNPATNLAGGIAGGAIGGSLMRSSIFRSSIGPEAIPMSGSGPTRVPFIPPQTIANAPEVKAGLNRMVGSIGKGLGILGLAITAAIAAYEIGKWLGGTKWASGVNKETPTLKNEKGEDVFKNAKEFEDWLNKERKDRIEKAFTKSTIAMASASEFVKEQNEPGNFLPNTKGDSKVIFTQAGERIKELNGAIADLAKQWKSKQDNPEFKAEKERLMKSLDEVWRVRSSSFNEIVKATEDEKKAIKEKHEKELEISKATVENEKEKANLLSEFGRDENKLRVDALKSLQKDQKDYKKSLRDLTFGKGEFGKTTDVQAFLQSSVKSFGAMEEEKRKLNEEAKTKEEETKKEYAEAIRDTAIEFSTSIKKLEEDMAKNRKDIEEAYAKKLEENTSSLNTLKEVIASLNMNVTPAY